MTEPQAGAIFGAGSNRTCREAATAIGTYVLQYFLDAARTECAFIGTNACCGRIGWQIAVAEFTRGEVLTWSFILQIDNECRMVA